MSNSSFPVATSPVRARRWLRPFAFVLLAGVVGVAAAVGVNSHANGGWHHGKGSADFATPEAVAAHVDRMLEHIYVEIDATDAQKARLDPIFRQAATDLMPLRQEFRAGHEQLLTLLSSETIDGAAIEAIRARHLQMADQASRTLTQLVVDAARELTPAQRKVLAERIAQHRRGGGHS